MKTIIKLSSIFCLMGLCGRAMAADPVLTVAVYDFKGEAEATSFGSQVTTLVTADLTDETNLVMLERADLNKALSEQAFGVSGMVSSDAAAKIGQITGAKVLVAGQVLKIGENHLVIIADVIGTETGRLFADKVEGAADDLLQLTSDLSRKIAVTIADQVTNLVAPVAESHENRVEQIVKGIKGKNRPAVSININQYDGLGENWRDTVAEGEIGAILLKAGFTVVDDNSDKKPDVEIVGSGSSSIGSPRGALFPCRMVIELKIQERRTGDIIGFDHQESTATDIGRTAAETAAQVETADDLAERILPLLAK
jgi:TolB-like protein